MARVLVRFSRPPGTAVATFKLAQQAGGEAMLRHWHEKYVPGHFASSAMKKYGYQPRSKKYQLRKNRERRGQDPLVYSGESRAVATDPASFRTRRLSSNISRGEFTGLPRYFYQYRKDAVSRTGDGKYVSFRSQPNKADELTRTTPAELEDMARVGEARITQFIERYRPPTSGVA